jgi:uncharacterized membrane protein
MAENNLTGVLERNVQALVEARRLADRRARTTERLADRITRFTGSMLFVGLHVLFFGGWLLINVNAIPGARPFDPFPFVMLAMIASVEAIFLTSFVLISQNRMAALDARRAELDVQIDLLAEHEITRLIVMVDAIAAHLGIEVGRDAHLEDLKRDVQPETVLERIEKAEHPEE